jgi:hypothetical protein
METLDLKIPHLRNLYQKIGRFGFPHVAPAINAASDGTLAASGTFMGDQVRGFCFLHDGSVDTIFRFHNAQVFNNGFTTANCGRTSPNVCRRNVEQLMFAFDSDLVPIVGQQVTLTGTNGGTVGARITLMLRRALAGECDVVVKGILTGLERGWVCTGSGCGGAGLFQSDRTGQTRLGRSSRILRCRSDPVSGSASTATRTASPTARSSARSNPRRPGERARLDHDDDGDDQHDDVVDHEHDGADHHHDQQHLHQHNCVHHLDQHHHDAGADYDHDRDDEQW